MFYFQNIIKYVNKKMLKLTEFDILLHYFFVGKTNILDQVRLVCTKYNYYSSFLRY
jgi:hypothetical protein